MAYVEDFMDTKQVEFAKRLTYVKAFLRGRKFYTALAALEFARRYHVGQRRDGSPEFVHQIKMALYHFSIIDLLMYPEETIAVDFTHDLREDYDLELPILRVKFGDAVAASTERMSKKYRGVEKSMDQYMAALAEDPVGSMVKAADRMHNFETMAGAFTPEKRLIYIEEGEHEILPMLKCATANFPQQASAYHNARHILRMQTEMLRQISQV